MKYNNPIICGFHPDPSICKADGGYYLVCSSFQYFPGVPIFESKDLVNWSQIGSVLTRKSQLPLKGASSNGGIYAPTIRYHKGRFYMVTTNVSHSGNFFVWTEEIHGEWSEPIYIDQDGIDPSLYFEGDTCYFMSNHSDELGRLVIMQCTIDVTTGKKLSDSRPIWYGTGGRYLESPHLYKINGTYYLMAAEGGTEYGHMVVYAIGNTPYGPFVAGKNNPVITNRDKGNYQLQGVGHADLVCDDNGNWWMVHLAFRQQDVYAPYHLLGREVCLVPVTVYEDGRMEAGVNGQTLLEMETDRITGVTQNRQHCYTFQNTSIGREWCYLRNPSREWYEWMKDSIRMKASVEGVDEETTSPALLLMRQMEYKGEVSVKVKVEGGESGVSFYMDQRHHYELGIVREKEGLSILVRRTIGDMSYVQKVQQIDSIGDFVELRIQAEPYRYRFSAICNGNEYDMGSALTRYLSSEVAGGFTGVMISLYATKREKESKYTTTFYDYKYEC